jgi:putative cell wall-binding protein
MRTKTLLATFLTVSLAFASSVQPAAALPPANETIMVSSSIELPNPQPADSDADDPSISGDGRFVAYSSAARNLHPLANGFSQVYLYDRETSTTQLVSGTSLAAGFGHSQNPAVSADGSFVAFESQTTDLLDKPSTKPQIALWSRATGRITLVSAADGTSDVQSTGASVNPVISDDGKTVAFVGRSSNLTAIDELSANQLYERSIPTNRTSMISQDLTRTPPTGLIGGVDTQVAISGDGDSIAFVAGAQITPVPTGGVWQLYVWHRNGGFTMASTNPAGTTGTTAMPTHPSLDTKGTKVIFGSAAADLPDSPGGATSQLYLRDLDSGTTALISRDYKGARLGETVDAAEISGDGTTVVFSTDDQSVTPESGWLGGEKQLYSLQLTTGRVSLVSRDQPGSGVADHSVLQFSVSANGSAVAFSSAASNLTTTPAGTSHQVYARSIDSTPYISRIGGADRYEVSANASRSSIGASSRVGYAPAAVFVTSGQTFPDALSASAAAGKLGGPVLLVRRDEVPAAVRAEILRLKPFSIYVVGGTASVSDATFAELAKFSPPSGIFRLDGADRYDVAVKVSARHFPSSDTVYLASGQNFPDALAGSAAAGAEKAPVLLTLRDRVPDAVRNEVARLKPQRIVVLGGPSTVSDSVLSTLTTIAPAVRLSGIDRYDGAAAMSRSAFVDGAETVYVASGKVYPDALSGSAIAIRMKAPVLLIPGNTIPASVDRELDRLDPHHIVVLGGSATLDEGVASALTKYLSP